MTELNAERYYRSEQCKKYFKQWYENLSVECILTTGTKIPVKILETETDDFASKLNSQTVGSGESDDEHKNVTCHVVTRDRDNKQFMENETPFATFKLEKEFTNEYEYYMQGSVAAIKKQLDVMNDRLEKYITHFPSNRIITATPSNKGSAMTKKSQMMTNTSKASPMIDGFSSMVKSGS